MNQISGWFRNASLVLVLLLVAGRAGLAVADEVILLDGSTLTGKVVSITEGKIAIETDFAGKLEIDVAQVQAVKTDEKQNIQFSSGERVIGTMSQGPTGQVINTQELGTVNTDLKNISAIWGMGQDAPEVAAVKEKLAKWSARLSLGLDGQSGNTDRVAINGETWVLRETPDDRLKIYGQGRASRENGIDTVKEVIGGTSLEVDVTDGLFVFGRCELEFDKIENIDFRATVTGGLGYTVIEEPGQLFKVRAGLGFMHESFREVAVGEKDSRSIAIAELGEEYRKEFTPWLLFNHSITYYPTFEDVGDFRIRMENRGDIPLNPDKNWKLSLGIRNDYNANPSPSTERSLDTFYFLNIAWDWN